MNSLTAVLETAKKFSEADIVYREILDFCKKYNRKDGEIGSVLSKIARINKIKSKYKYAEKLY